MSRGRNYINYHSIFGYSKQMKLKYMVTTLNINNDIIDMYFLFLLPNGSNMSPHLFIQRRILLFIEINI